MASLFIGFLVETYVALAKSEIRFRMASFFVFHLAWCVRRLKSLKRFWPYLKVFSASWMVSLSNYCIWCLFFISNLMKSSVVYAAIWFMHVYKIWDNDLTEYQVCSMLVAIPSTMWWIVRETLLLPQCHNCRINLTLYSSIHYIDFMASGGKTTTTRSETTIKIRLEFGN